MEHLFPRIFEGGHKKKNHEQFMHTSPTKSPREKPQNPPRENHQDKASKIRKKGKWEKKHKALKNHAESSIHTMKVHTRSSLPPYHPYLSKDLTMKLSS
jgi:hypothetical protein